jgi:hypothetical protein
MARPRLGDGKTERVHLVITDSEIDAIEAWRFRNLVQSKSEAIRKLCQIGLALEAAAPRIVEALERLTPDMTEPSPEVRVLYDVLGPLIIGRLGIHSMSDMQIEVDQSTVMRALWDAANKSEGEEEA